MQTQSGHLDSDTSGRVSSLSEKQIISPEVGIITDDSSKQDVFVDDETHDIRYKTLSWQLVSFLMVAEVVTNGMLTLPNAMAVVGIVPSLILTIFLGIFGLFTAKLLIDFKLNHPNVHSMGDAGYIIFGPIGREVLSAGTVIFAICSTIRFSILSSNNSVLILYQGSLLLSGQQALSTLSDKRLCSIYFLLIFAVATLAVSMPRTLGHLTHLSILSVSLITISGFVAMIGAGVNPTAGRIVVVSRSSSFYEAFLAVTSPVFAYAGHFMFFIFISEMRRPQDAMKAAWALQIFATAFYSIFSVIMYIYLGSGVQSPAFFSLTPILSKVTFGIAMINFLMSGSLCCHTAAKLVFIRLFRHSRHVYSHTFLGWSVWTMLCSGAVGIAFVLAIAVPILSDLIGITASLFASWYTYGIAGFFWLHDTYHLGGGREALKRRWIGTSVAVLTILAGAFMCIAGTYVSIELIVVAYNTGLVGKPFSC